jgi:ubiquinone/menaquinone biosynthesis C-methylase UbiE
MDHREMMALIRPAVPGEGGSWADLGAGAGNFTRALGNLLGPKGTIYAVDRAESSALF